MATPELKGMRVGFVSTRITGTDGVSLEIEKWAEVFQEKGIECFYIAGESDRPAERTALIEEAHFTHPVIQDIRERAFASERRDARLTNDILDMARLIETRLSAAIEDFGLRAIIAENAVTIPMNISLGIALVTLAQESGLGFVAHHHDFYWERERFLVNAVDDFLRYAFPPALPFMHHVVINSLAGQEFSRRTGLSCRIIPNIMNFEAPPEPPDDYARSFRESLGISHDEWLILQPTRVVPRKNIEGTIELARRLDGERAKVVISHASGDEGDDYAVYLRELAELMDVTLIYADDWIAEHRGKRDDGRRLYTIKDAYQAANLVAYPSGYEGFGNAFLEAVYYRCPVICNRYSIYRTDIEPCGMRPVVFDGFVTKRAVDEVRRVLDDEARRKEMVEHNYEAASRFFGYDALREEIALILRRPQNIYRLIGKGIREH